MLTRVGDDEMLHNKPESSRQKRLVSKLFYHYSFLLLFKGENDGILRKEKQ